MNFSPHSVGQFLKPAKTARTTEWEILIGGVKLSHLGLNSYQHLIGPVMQDDQLFAGSIGDNVCFFFDEAPTTVRKIARTEMIQSDY